MKHIFFLVLVALFFFMACDTSAPDFTGEWKLKKIVVDEEEMFGNQLGSPLYYFDESGTYSIKISELIQQGEWKQNGKKVKLIDKEQKDNITNIEIIDVDENELVYKVKSSIDSESIVYMTRVEKKDAEKKL